MSDQSRLVALALVLVLAASAVVVGVAMVFPPAAWMAAGVLGALVGWLTFGDVS